MGRRLWLLESKNKRGIKLKFELQVALFLWKSKLLFLFGKKK